SGIAVDSRGNMYLTGLTGSLYDFPIANAWQLALSCPEEGTPAQCPSDAFIAKLGYDGSQPIGQQWTLYYSSYLGGTDSDEGHGIALHPVADMVYVVGSTGSEDFPVVSPAYSSLRGGLDGFVARIGTMPVERGNSPAATWLKVGLAEVAPNTGALRITHPLDFRQSVPSAQDSTSVLGVAPALVYNSDTASVRPIGAITPRWHPS